MGKRKLLWHYTTLESLAAILKSGELWATKYQFLNDRSEMLSGFEAANIWVATHEKSEINQLTEDENFFSALAASIGSTYVISFSEAFDSLSMWRGYGDAVSNNTGVAIGFSLEDLEQLSQGQRFEGPLKCNYWSSQNESDFFDDIPLPEQITEAGTQVFSYIAERIPYIKSHYFREEEEWRLVSKLCPRGNDADLVRLTSRGTKMAFNLCKLAPDERKLTDVPMGIVEVIAGPKTDFALMSDILEGGFAKFGAYMPNLKRSEIPFV